jgi:hypothetical protein
MHAQQQRALQRMADTLLVAVIAALAQSQPVQVQAQDLLHSLWQSSISVLQA